MCSGVQQRKSFDGSKSSAKSTAGGVVEQYNSTLGGITKHWPNILTLGIQYSRNDSFSEETSKPERALYVPRDTLTQMIGATIKRRDRSPRAWTVSSCIIWIQRPSAHLLSVSISFKVLRQASSWLCSPVWPLSNRIEFR